MKKWTLAKKNDRISRRIWRISQKLDCSIILIADSAKRVEVKSPNSLVFLRFNCQTFFTRFRSRIEGKSVVIYRPRSADEAKTGKKGAKTTRTGSLTAAIPQKYLLEAKIGFLLFESGSWDAFPKMYLSRGKKIK